MVTNPSNIDIDHLGRVWVCEGYNYRTEVVGDEPRQEGDRILILEDTDGDGLADSTTVFYQDPSLDSPLGLLVLGDSVIVSQSPYIWLLIDDDGDGKANKKEILFQGIGGEYHDHGVHAMVFGSDGRFYFNYGNFGKQLLDRNGNPVRDQAGEVIDFTQYKEGMVFRCDGDFDYVEILGHNFRNPYELAVDSYGTVWQSDNDDDGNRSVRINYVMEGGDFGFTEQLTGASWQVDRTNLEDSIPRRHWHQNDPGVIPNLLHTGAGSPTGLTVYEGRLLPERYINQLIHCDAGPNVVRSYPVVKSGAGYTARIEPVLSSIDQWFRPTDVCVAPDGSLIVADWYDPSVGGHQIGDRGRGRLYRIAPPGKNYRKPKLAFSTAEDALTALASPNQTARYLAYKALSGMGKPAYSLLSNTFNDRSTDSRMRARCLWLMAALRSDDTDLFTGIISDSDPDIRMSAIRVMRQHAENQLFDFLPQLVRDPDAAVRRECALALKSIGLDEASGLWAELALRHGGDDRWYLEALGLAADGRWGTFAEAWSERLAGDLNSHAGASDIVWRSRNGVLLSTLGSLAADSREHVSDRLRYFRAFDFHPSGAEKSKVIMEVLESSNRAADEDALRFGLMHIDKDFVASSDEARRLLNQALGHSYRSNPSEFLQLLNRFDVKDKSEELVPLLWDSRDNAFQRGALAYIQRHGRFGLLEEVVSAGDTAKISVLLGLLLSDLNTNAIGLLASILLNEGIDDGLKTEAVKALCSTNTGQDTLLTLVSQDKLDVGLAQAAVQGLVAADRAHVREAVSKHLTASREEASGHPELSVLAGMDGDLTRGKAVFATYCSMCHKAKDEGYDFGPDLSEIGDKLPKEGLYAAIFDPDAGISFGYEGYTVRLKDGLSVGGIVLSRTDEELVLKNIGGATKSYRMDDVVSMTVMENSLMPPGLQHAMTTSQLVDLIEYLSRLK